MAAPSRANGPGVAETAAVTRDLYQGRQPLPRPKLLLYTLAVAIGAWAVLRHSLRVAPLDGFCFAALITAGFYVLAKHRLGLSYQAEVVRDGRAALLPFLQNAPVHLDLAAVPSMTRRGPVVTGAGFDGAWLYIVEDGVAARIPGALIRKWQWAIETYQSQEVRVNVSVNGGVVSPAVPDFARSAAITRGLVMAKLASGLTVQVADVSKPSWRFTTDDRAVLEKWHEILTQVSEGKLVAG